MPSINWKEMLDELPILLLLIFIVKVDTLKTDFSDCEDGWEKEGAMGKGEAVANENFPGTDKSLGSIAWLYFIQAIFFFHFLSYNPTQGISTS